MTKEEALLALKRGEFHCWDCGLFNGLWDEYAYCTYCQWKWADYEDDLAEADALAKTQINNWLSREIA